MSMKINGTLINYYFHCKRQCYLHGNRLNFEDNSENVKIGKALHEIKENKNTEIEIDNIKIDKLTKYYLTEIKKSDADPEAAKWQLIFYLNALNDKGIRRKGKLEFIEKNKTKNKIIYVELNSELIKELEKHIRDIKILINSNNVPDILNKSKCKRCAYYEYCYI